MRRTYLPSSNPLDISKDKYWVKRYHWCSKLYSWILDTDMNLWPLENPVTTCPPPPPPTTHPALPHSDNPRITSTMQHHSLLTTSGITLGYSYLFKWFTLQGHYWASHPHGAADRKQFIKSPLAYSVIPGQVCVTMCPRRTKTRSMSHLHEQLKITKGMDRVPQTCVTTSWSDWQKGPL